MMTTTWKRRRPGWVVIARKEFADHLVSGRFVAVLVVLGLVAVGSVYSAATALSGAASDVSGAPGTFLRLFTVQGDPVPFSFLTFLGFLAPILGIAFGFDAINGERAEGTLPRLVSQPVHRDDVVNGKFVAGLSVVGLMMVVVALVVAGLGIVLLGIVPTAAEVTRLVVWLVAAVVYVGVWLALATLASVRLRSASTSAMVSLGVWLVLALFGGLIAQVVADALAPATEAPDAILATARLELGISRLSPIVLYEEAATALLNPSVRSVGLVTFGQLDRAVASELSLSQSLLLVWPQLVGLVAVTVVLFAVAYISFMRQEVRA